MEKNYKEILERVNTLIFDFDGIFTDGSAFMMPGHVPLRSTNAKDTYAVQLAAKKGITIAILTGGTSEEIRNRFNMLGVSHIFLGSRNKLAVFNRFCEEHSINPDNVLYMGDDIPDYQVMKHVALPCCPADAVQEIKSVSKYISHIKGGKGCVREIIEQVLKVKGLWFDQDAFEW